MSARLFAANGQWVDLDKRHVIALEGTGDLKRQWVFRFCGEFIGAYRTKKEATGAALMWEIARVTRLAG